MTHTTRPAMSSAAPSETWWRSRFREAFDHDPPFCQKHKMREDYHEPCFCVGRTRSREIRIVSTSGRSTTQHWSRLTRSTREPYSDSSFRMRESRTMPLRVTTSWTGCSIALCPTPPLAPLRPEWGKRSLTSRTAGSPTRQMTNGSGRLPPSPKRAPDYVRGELLAYLRDYSTQPEVSQSQTGN